MPTKNPRLWAYSLPVALVLLDAFNILASLGMDIYLPIVLAMPGILDTTPEVVQFMLTLYMIMLGVGTAVVIMLDGSTAWPLMDYTGGMAAVTLALLTCLARAETQT